MINTNKLERKWFLYKVKIALPYAITATSLTLISLILYIFLSTNMQTRETLQKSITQPKKEINATQKSPITTKTILKKEKPIDKIPEETLVKVVKKVVSKEIKNRVSTDTQKAEYTLLKPSLNFLNQINKESTPQKMTTEAKMQKSVQVIPKQTIENTSKIVSEQKQQRNQNITITQQDAYSEIQEVIKRFNKNKNPALSLFIAKKYYALGKYTKSYNYALATNELDNDIEDSWLIFAKSLVKLNEKEMAVKILKKYIAHSASYRASTLLNEINTGKFK